MKKPTVTQGILLAALISVISIPLWTLLTFFFYDYAAWRILVLAISCTYVLYILAAHQSSVGKISLGVLSLAVFFGLAIIAISPLTLFLSCLGIIWIVRVFLRYSSILPAILDGVLCLFAFAGLIVSYSFTASIFVATWTFLLIQSLSALIPRKFTRSNFTGDVTPNTSIDPFHSAYETAQQALRVLSQY